MVDARSRRYFAQMKWTHPRSHPGALLLAFVLAFAAPGCRGDEARVDGARAAGASEPATPPAPPETDGTGQHVLTCDMLPDSLLQAEPTRAGLLARYGSPVNITSAVEPNRHVDGAVDSLFTLSYPGLQVTIRTPAQGRDMAETVHISDNRYIRFPDVGMGAAASHVLDRLGEPWEVQGDRLVYNCGMGADQPTTFLIADAHVTAIMIEYYVD